MTDVLTRDGRTVGRPPTDVRDDVASWWAPAARGFAVVALGTGAVAARLWGHGAAGRSAAIVIVVVAALAEALVVAFASPPRHRLAVMAVAAVIAELLTVAWVGRAPAALALAATAIADAAWWPTRRDRPGRAPVVLAAVGTGLVASWIWYADGRLAPTVATWLVAGAVVLAAARLPAVGKAMDARTAAATAPAADAALAGAVRVRRRCRAVATGSADMASSATGRIRDAAGAARRTVTSAARWCAAPCNRPAVAAGVVAGLVTTPIFWRIAVDPTVFIRGTNDINSGIPRIEAMSWWPPVVTLAHPVYFVLIKFLAIMTGFAVATTAVGVVATGAAVTVMVLWMRGRWDRQAPLVWPTAIAAGIGALLIENPAVLVPRTDGVWGRSQTAGTVGRGPGYLALHQWATPTIVASVPLVIGMYAMVRRFLAEPEAATAPRRRFLAALTIFTTLLQPATTLALVPAAILWALAHRRRRDARRILRPLWWSFLIPGTVVCLGQVVFLASDVSEWERATWEVRPFWVWNHLGMDRVACWLALPFFVLPLLTGARRYLADDGVRLVLGALAVSLPPFLLLEQTTVAAIPDADLGVPVLMSVWLLTWTNMRYLAIELQTWWARREPASRTPAWVGVMAAVVTTMAAAGVVDLLAALGVTGEL